MGRGETLIVVVKVTILLLFAASGLWFIKPESLAPKAFTVVSSTTEPTASDLSSNVDGVVVMKVAAWLPKAVA